MTVRQLLNNLDSREIAEWAAYFKLQASPPQAQDEPFYSDDPQVMANKMREILAPKRRKRK